jgi:hypothetical protein
MSCSRDSGCAIIEMSCPRRTVARSAALAQCRGRCAALQGTQDAPKSCTRPSGGGVVRAPPAARDCLASGARRLPVWVRSSARARAKPLLDTSIGL